MRTGGTDLETGQDRKAPGRPRNEKADEAIIEAAIALLAAGQSAAALSMEAVAAKAGVGKATIYRRWPNKEALLIDTVATMKGPLPELKGESVRDDLIALIAANWTSRARRYGKVTACLLPQYSRDDEMRRVYQAITEPRREAMRSVLRRGIALGELRPDLDIELTMLMLSGPSVVQNMLNFNPNVPEEGFPEALVDALIRGMQA
ncbi:TetR/AcrR family transcriptional regulator [Actinoplanes sp. NPDC051343]|uniref:TetR/AcrR family transcriptional regulator n=1 Tax=Actinoplanes sp. NPDC051343 TaxID=3363906 RepID=UPI0037B531D0